MLIMEILIGITLLIGGPLWIYITLRKVKDLRSEVKIRQNECAIAARLLKETHESQVKMCNQNAKIAKEIEFNNGVLTAIKKQNEEKLIQLKMEQEQKKSEMLKKMHSEYAIDAGQIIKEINQIKRSLDRERAKIGAVTAARKLSEKESVNRDFHRVCVSIANINDIKKLKNMALELKKPEVLYKLIWKEYYQSLTGDMINRVVGSHKISGIYKITYIPDGRSYIGRSVDIAERFRQHIKCGLKAAKGAAPFYEALFSLGVENFTFEILQQCEFGQVEELVELESYYIDFYDSVISGFNTLNGSR